MGYPAARFFWGWSNLPSNASLSDVIDKINWIGENLDTTFTPWIEGNNTDYYNNIELAKTDASSAATAASNAQTAASNAATAASNARIVADRAEAKADVANGKISRCSYLRGTH